MKKAILACMAASLMSFSGPVVAEQIIPPTVTAKPMIEPVRWRGHGGWRGHRGFHRGWHRGWRGGARWHGGWHRGWRGRGWGWRRGWGYGFYGGAVIGTCAVVRNSCAARWGWGGPNWRRCVWRRGC